MRGTLSARRPCAGAVPGRWGACLAVRTPPAAFVDQRRTDARSVLFHFFQFQHFRGFRAEANEISAVLRIGFHPRDSLVVPLAGLVLLAEPPVGHGEEEPGKSVATSCFDQGHDLFSASTLAFQSPAR